ncbi:MAG: DUF2249 domain-containing protein [Erysipelotrichaceae bacterium]|nr:DUF2249 domain-containing protein [Erysipelotrichaceae bacterium]
MNNEPTIFRTMDVRGIHGNFLEGIRKQALACPVGQTLEIIQTFEPIPLYDVMTSMGYTYQTRQVKENEYHVYFTRRQSIDPADGAVQRPTVIAQYPMIDEKLGQLVVQFWDLTWNEKNRYLDHNTRLLISLANAVGAGRMRQALRELVKAVQNGLDTRALDDVFEQLAWNMGIGTFSSEIAPSALFRAYSLIKQMEKQGKGKEEIHRALRAFLAQNDPV